MFGESVQLDPLVPANYGTISNGELQTFGSAVSATLVAPGSTQSPDAMGSGTQQFWSLSANVEVAAPLVSQIGMRLRLIFNAASGTPAVSFDSIYQIPTPPSATSTGTSWVCELMFDGTSWRQTSGSASWL